MNRITKAIVLTLAVLVQAGLTASTGQEVLSLDGEWEIIFDHHNEGKDAGWNNDGVFSKHPAIRSIQVPSCWEEYEKNYEGVAFYRRNFELPSDWKGKTVRLQFDAVNYLTEAWINDQVIGFHEGGFSSFEFRVDDLIKPGEENTLILRVVGPILFEDKRIDGMGRMEVPQWRGAISGGIWQPVKLVAADEVMIKDVFLQSNIANDTVKFDVELEHTGHGSKSVEVQTMIRLADNSGKRVARTSKRISLRPGLNKSSWTVKIPDARYWSPDDPFLYRAEVQVKESGNTSDQWEHRFGMREFTIRNNQFELNGKPLYLKGTFFEGLYPVKLAYPDSREMARKEIQLAKDAGFNMIRPWRKPPPLMWLDLCDEIGMLTVGSLAIECMSRPISTPQLPFRVENELRQSILRDRNRTCLVKWELFNELHRPILKQMLRPMSLIARELDPTRLILDESGGFAGGASMYLPFEYDHIKFNDIHYYPGELIGQEIYDGLLVIGKTDEEREAMGLGHVAVPGAAASAQYILPGRMSVISELGSGSLPDLVANNRQFAEEGNPILAANEYHRWLADDHQTVLKETGFDSIYPDLQEFCLEQQRIHGMANKRMIEGTRANPDINGYLIHALTGGDWVIGAGLLDLWRNPKTDVYEMTKQANQPRIVSARALPRNVRADEGTRLQVIGINELENVKGKLHLEVTDESGKVVFNRSLNSTLKSGVANLFEKQLDTTQFKGTYTIQVRLEGKSGELVAENDHSFDVFTADQLVAPGSAVAVLDPSDSLTPFLEAANIDYKPFSKGLDKTIPVIVGSLGKMNPRLKGQVEELRVFVKQGGKAIFLDVPGSRTPNLHRKLENVGTEGLPFTASLMRGRGTWIQIPHIIKDHPVFDGLPVNCMMEGIYGNVLPWMMMIKQEGELIAGSVSYDWYKNKDKMFRHYRGPGDVFWAAEVVWSPVGKGHMLLSTLTLIENLGKDPVADKILFNMIRFATNQ